MSRATVRAPALLTGLVSFPCLAGLWACSGGSSTAPGTTGTEPAAAFEGRWEGTWTTAALPPVGTVALELEQAGATLTGSATFAGHPCLLVCTVSCQVDQHDLSGTLEAGSFSLQFAGGCAGSEHASGPHHPQTLTAAYQIGGGPCEGQSGTMELTWQGASGAPHHGPPH